MLSPLPAIERLWLFDPNTLSPFPHTHCKYCRDDGCLRYVGPASGQTRPHRAQPSAGPGLATYYISSHLITSVRFSISCVTLGGSFGPYLAARLCRIRLRGIIEGTGIVLGGGGGGGGAVAFRTKPKTRVQPKTLSRTFELVTSGGTSIRVTTARPGAGRPGSRDIRSVLSSN